MLHMFSKLFHFDTSFHVTCGSAMRYGGHIIPILLGRELNPHTILFVQGPMGH
jgi:hypothetical protein